VVAVCRGDGQRERRGRPVEQASGHE